MADGVFRVYAWGPLLAARGTREEVQAFFDQRLAGRVYSSDVEFRESRLVPGSWMLLVRRPMVVAEFRDKARADTYLANHRDGLVSPQVVERGSDEERVFTDYGRKMLPQAAGGSS